MAGLVTGKRTTVEFKDDPATGAAIRPFVGRFAGLDEDFYYFRRMASDVTVALPRDGSIREISQEAS